MSPFDKGGFWWLHLKRCIIGQAVGPQHILHHIDVGADVEGGLQVFDLSTNKLQSSMPKVAKTATQVLSY